MTTSIDYELHKLTGTIDDVGVRLPPDFDTAGDKNSVFHPEIRMRTAAGTAVLSNVYVPKAIDALIQSGVSCDLYVVEAEAQLCPPGHGCVAQDPFCHVFAIDCGRDCMSAVHNTARHFGAIKRRGIDLLLSWAGMALLVSFVLIGIPFLIYFGILTLLALAIRIPSADELRRFLGNAGFPVGRDCAA